MHQLTKNLALPRMYTTRVFFSIRLSVHLIFPRLHFENSQNPIVTSAYWLLTNKLSRSGVIWHLVGKPETVNMQVQLHGVNYSFGVARECPRTKDGPSIRLHYFSLHRRDVIREDDVSHLFMYEGGARAGRGYKQNNIDDTAPRGVMNH
ncbi:hypothetical protein EVAR_64254_1 [Eumeta japonica]|uniref:Uncharacterized protein n=1 Tax=Eumeta variegata TaxID=151549 RepID=A0A4C1YX89_EUMVA|nr:hypothetical protein EVAR_64254_1 [Eumeta japonica]